MDLIALTLTAIVAFSALPSVKTVAPEHVAVTAGQAYVHFPWGSEGGLQLGINAPLLQRANLRAEAAVNLLHASRSSFFGCHLLKVGFCDTRDDYHAVEGMIRLEPTRSRDGMLRPYLSVGYVVGTMKTSEDEVEPPLCASGAIVSPCPAGLASMHDYKQSVTRPVWAIGIHSAQRMFGLPVALDIGFTPPTPWSRQYQRMNTTIGFWY